MCLLIAAIYAVDTYSTRGRLSAIALGLLAVGGVWEFARMLRGAGHAVASGLLVAVTALLAGTAVVFNGWQQLDRELYPPVIGTFVLLVPIAVHSLAKDRMKDGLETQGSTLLGFVWIGWSLYLGQGLAIRHLPAVLFVIAVCKGGDIGAYFTGRALGRRKLAPHVSQGKTVEGAIGGMVASCAIAAALHRAMAPASAGLGLTAAVASGIMLNVAAQLGDLVESLLKRRCGVKDSSRLLPAHGGILDLVDSLLFAFPAHFLLLVSLT
jgi:CDP-diglyceride synthetase